MKGRQIYFTQQEIKALFNVLDEWEDILLDKGKDDEEKYAHHL